MLYSIIAPLMQIQRRNFKTFATQSMQKLFLPLMPAEAQEYVAANTWIGGHPAYGLMAQALAGQITCMQRYHGAPLS